jgi:hypothetical protein
MVSIGGTANMRSNYFGSSPNAYRIAVRFRSDAAGERVGVAGHAPRLSEGVSR